MSWVISRFTHCLHGTDAASFQSSDVYKNLVAYFDQNFALFLPSGRWSRDAFASEGRIGSDRKKGYKGNMRAHIESDSEYDEGSSMPGLQSVSNTSEDNDDSKRIRREGSASYQVSQLTPLSTSPAWDEINAQLNIPLTGPESLKSLCDEAHFTRSRLTKTSSTLLNDFTQAKAALLCLEQITDENTTEDLRVAFAKLLPHSLSHARQWPELVTNIQILLTQHSTLCKRLPLVTMNAIAEYLRRFPTPSESQKTRTAAEVVPKAVPKSSTKATTDQNASKTPTPSTARRKAQKSSPSSPPPSTTDSEHGTPSQPQLVPRTFLVPSHSTQIQPSPSTSQNASTVSRIPQKKASTTPTSSTARRKVQKSSPPSQPPSTTDSKHRTPSQPQPVPRTFLAPPYSAQTQPSPSSPQKSPTSPRPPPSTGLKISNPSQPQPASCAPRSSAPTQPSTMPRTPEQPNASQPAMTLDPKSSTVLGPPTTSGATFSSPYLSKPFTSAQSTSDSSQRLQGPSRHGDSKKCPWK